MTELHDDLVTLTNAFIDLQNALSVIPGSGNTCTKVAADFLETFQLFFVTCHGRHRRTDGHTDGVQCISRRSNGRVD